VFGKACVNPVIWTSQEVGPTSSSNGVWTCVLACLGVRGVLTACLVCVHARCECMFCFCVQVCVCVCVVSLSDRRFPTARNAQVRPDGADARRREVARNDGRGSLPRRRAMGANYDNAGAFVTAPGEGFARTNKPRVRRSPSFLTRCRSPRAQRPRSASVCSCDDGQVAVVYSYAFWNSRCHVM
jgi:hypothetical protein